MLPTVKTDLFAVNQMVATWDVPAPLRMLQKNVNLVLLRIYTGHAWKNDICINILRANYPEQVQCAYEGQPNGNILQVACSERGNYFRDQCMLRFTFVYVKT